MTPRTHARTQASTCSFVSPLPGRLLINRRTTLPVADVPRPTGAQHACVLNAAVTGFLGWWKDEVRKNDGLTQRPNSSEKVVSLSTLSKVAVKQSKAKQSKALHVNVTVFYLGFPNKPNIVWLCYLHTLAPSLEQNKAMYGTFLWSLCSCWRQVKWRHCDWLKCVGGEGTMSTSDYHHHHHHRHHFIRSKSNTCMSIKWTVQ